MKGNYFRNLKLISICEMESKGSNFSCRLSMQQVQEGKLGCAYRSVKTARVGQKLRYLCHQN